MKLETREKIRQSLKIHYREHRKEKRCKFCGRTISADRRKSKYCSDECRIKDNQVISLIKYFEFDLSVIGTTEVFNEWDRVKHTLEELYWKEEKTSTEICKMFGYPNSSNLTSKIFKYLEIKSKTAQESTHLNYKNGILTPPTNNVYHQGWHTTWDNKRVYLRSSYEFEFAKYLDRLHTHYTVEELRIEYFDTVKNCKRIAIPDFYSSKENLIVEVKSNYTLNIQNMIDKAREYRARGYNFLLFLENHYLTLEELENNT